MLTGTPPFRCKNREDVYECILNTPPEMKPFFSDKAQDLLKKLMCVDRKHRLQDPAIVKAHPFFQGINWNALYSREVEPPF